MSDGGRQRVSLGVKVVEVISNVGAKRSAVRSIAWLDLGEHGVDVQDEPRMEANMFGFAPPALATRRSE